MNENWVWIRNEIEKERLNLYFNRITKPWISVVKEVSADDEWLAEAYMETDYSKVSEEDFQKTVNNYISYLIKKWDVNETK